GRCSSSLDWWAVLGAQALHTHRQRSFTNREETRSGSRKTPSQPPATTRRISRPRKLAPCCEEFVVGKAATSSIDCFRERPKRLERFVMKKLHSWRLHSRKHLRRPHRTTASIFISVMRPSRAMRRARPDGCR